MNIAQLSEQLKDVPQNRLIDYARNPNSVVPQFLALAEIQRRQHLQSQAAPAPATVAEDVLGQAAPIATQIAQQLPENQPGVAQLPTGMPQGMASGGIVAFASGGDIDDEEDAYDPEEMQIQRDENRIRSLVAAMRSRAGEAASVFPRVVQAIKEKLPESYESAKAKADATIGIAGLKGTHPYEPVAIDEAKKLGLDLNLVRHVLHKETGGLKDPATARSKAGAYGPMQLMPGTAKELGVDITDPEQNTRGGVRYLAQMMNKFKDPTLALAAYNAGPGRVQQMLRRGQGIESLSPETQGYVKFAKGGIASYAGPKGSVVQSDDDEEDYETDYLRRSRGLTSGVRNVYNALTTPKNYDLYDMYQNYIGKPFASGVNRFISEPLEDQAARFRSYSRNPNASVGYSTPAGSNVPVSASAVGTPSPYGPSENERLHARYPSPIVRDAQPTDQDWRDFDQASALFNAEQRLIQPPEQAGPPEPDYYKEALLRVAKGREDLKAQAEQDKYMAILQAGLGMMAGSSPYALQNIGAGGMQGASAYAAAKKQRAAEAAALGKEELSIRRLKQLEDSEKAALEQAAELKRAGFSQKEVELYQKKISEARDDLRMYEQMRVKQIENKYTKNPLWGTDPKLKQAYDLEIANLYNDPQYLALFKLGYPNIDLSQKSSGTTSGSRPPLSSFNK